MNRYGFYSPSELPDSWSPGVAHSYGTENNTLALLRPDRTLPLVVSEHLEVHRLQPYSRHQDRGRPLSGKPPLVPIEEWMKCLRRV